jgi:hypothetical protein
VKYGLVARLTRDILYSRRLCSGWLVFSVCCAWHGCLVSRSRGKQLFVGLSYSGTGQLLPVEFKRGQLLNTVVLILSTVARP